MVTSVDNITKNLSTKISITVDGDSLDDDELSSRGRELEQAGGLADKFKKIFGNLYDPVHNPNGIVNIGVAENYVMTKEAAKFAQENESKICPEAVDFGYGQGPWGTPRLRKAMARHINRLFKPLHTVEPSRIIFANGVTSLCDELGFTLCDPGDAILMSRPIYQAFKSDFGTKAKVQCLFVEFHDLDQFSLDAVQNYERALLSAQAQGIRVRALILCHPHNPLGRCYPPETIIGIMQLCNWYHVHLLVDEIYAMSVYEVPDVSDPKTQEFHSVLSLDTDKYIDSKYLHLLYGMSKDMAAGGLRLGCIYTRNERLLRAISATSPFAWSGNLNEKMAATMLEDEPWMDDFLEKGRRVLARHNSLARKLLDEAGIKYHLGANAGLFLWIDLRPWLRSVQMDKEDPFAGEDELTAKLIENGVFITNGKELSAEQPGWYRFIFSQEEDLVRVGVERIVKTLKAQAEVLAEQKQREETAYLASLQKAK